MLAINLFSKFLKFSLQKNNNKIEKERKKKFNHLKFVQFFSKLISVKCMAAL